MRWTTERLLILAVLNGLALAQVAAAPQTTTTKVEWTNLIPIESLADIDADLQADFDEPVEVERVGGDGGRVTIRNCVDYLGLVADGDFDAGNFSDYLIIHSNGLYCYELQLLKNARPAKTSFLRDFKFDENVIDILSPQVGLFEGNEETEKADGRVSLKQFEPRFKVTDTQEDILCVETTRTWEADIAYLARGDFDGQGLEEILIEVRGQYKEGQGTRGLDDVLYILTRTKDSGPLKVVREIR
jgi:hypothetical protein